MVAKLDTTEKIQFVASRWLLVKIIAAFAAVGGALGAFGGYKALAISPADQPSAVLNRIEGHLGKMQEDIAALQLDVGILKAMNNKGK